MTLEQLARVVSNFPEARFELRANGLRIAYGESDTFYEWTMLRTKNIPSLTEEIEFFIEETDDGTAD